MDADLPDRVLAALGLLPPLPAGSIAPTTPPTSRHRLATRRTALALGLGAILSLLWLPSGDERDVRQAGSPLFATPAPTLAPSPRPTPPASVVPPRSAARAAGERPR